MDVVALGLAKADAARRYLPIGGQPPALSALPPRPTRTMLQTFQSGHGWSASGAGAGGSTDLNNTDAAATLIGSQAVKATTGGTGLGRSLYKLAGTSIDMTGKQFSVLITVPDPTHLKQISVEAGTGGLANYSRFYAQSSNSTLDEIYQPGLPTWVDIPWFITNGGGTGITRNAITDLQVTVTDDNTGNPVVVYIHALAATPIPAPWSTSGVGCLAFSLDDGTSEHFNTALPKLARAGFAPNIWPICESIDTAGRMTTAQLQIAQNTFGASVGAHSFTTATHTAGYSNLSDAAQLADMRAARKWLMDRGLYGYDLLAYPQGQFHGSTLGIARTQVVAARTTNGRMLDTLPLSDPQKIRAFTVVASTPVATVTAMIDRAKAANAYLELVYHQLVPSGATGFASLIADFNTVVDYAAASGMPVKTLPQLLATR